MGELKSNTVSPLQVIRVDVGATELVHPEPVGPETDVTSANGKLGSFSGFTISKSIMDP